jgi:trehalose 6-phosphate phosphatase
MQYLLRAAGKQALQRLVSEKSTLYAFDFDGTLTRIVRDRNAPCLSEPIRNALYALSAYAPTAVISGRALADLAPRIDGAAAHLVGNHGLEGLHSSTHVMQQALDCCRSWKRTTGKCLQALARSGVLLEDKTYSLTFHYRSAESPQVAREHIFHAIAQLGPPPRIVLGKSVVNVIPPATPHKGAAMLELMHQLKSAAALYVGDDDTDEDVFSLPDDRIVTVRIGHKARSAARYYLKRQGEISALLTWLLAARTSGAAHEPS